VVVNDVGDLAEYVIPGRNGYVVDPNNSREVAAAIANACENSRSMREACIASMVPYDEAVIDGMAVGYIINGNHSGIK